MLKGNESASSYEKNWEGTGPQLLLLLIGGAIEVGATVVLFQTVEHGEQPATAKVPGLFYWVFVGTMVIGAMVFLELESRRRRRLDLHVGILHRYECAICGYRWRWVEGQPEPAPPPASSTQPPNNDLLQHEMQRLNDAAAAAAWEQQRERERHEQ